MNTDSRNKIYNLIVRYLPIDSDSANTLLPRIEAVFKEEWEQNTAIVDYLILGAWIQFGSDYHDDGSEYYWNHFLSALEDIEDYLKDHKLIDNDGFEIERGGDK